MASKKKRKPVASARSAIRQPHQSDDEMISATRVIGKQMKPTTIYASSPSLQNAQAQWSAAADALESTGREIAAAQKKLAALQAKQRANRQRWRERKSQVLGAADVACKGSKDDMQSLGFRVITRSKIGALPAPSGFVVVQATARGEALVAWQRGRKRRWHMLQTALDPEDPKTYSEPKPVGGSKHTITGPSGTIVHARLAAMDTSVPSGIGPWTDWISCTLG